MKLHHFLNNRILYPMSFLAIFMLIACQKDDARLIAEPEDRSMTVHVVLPDPVVSTPGTRAGATDFDRIQNLHIVIAEKNAQNPDDAEIEQIFYYETGTGGSSGNPGIEEKEGSIDIHFAADYVLQNNLDKKDIFLVANYSEKLIGPNGQSLLSPNTIGNLRSLKQQSSDMPGVPNGCMMFAQAVNNGKGHTHEDGTSGITLDAPLARTVAMITVAIDGSGLAKNVAITPRRISLHRVPRQCYLDRENNPYRDNSIEIVESGESKGGRGELNWPTIVGTATPLTADGFTPWGTAAAHEAGEHYTSASGSQEGIDYSNPNVAPLFMFENIHGQGFGASGANEKMKRPAVCPPTITPEQLHAHSSTATCSYLEIEAYYLRMNDEMSASLYSGTVRFRLFLGEDETESFDVYRNKYYKVTLTLNGYAITEGGQVDSKGELVPDNGEATWRIESELGKASFETEDVVLGGSGEYFPIDIQVADDVVYTITGSTNNIFLSIYNNSQGGMWSSVAQGEVKATLVNGQIWIYAMPAIDEKTGTWDPETHSRTQTITLTAKSTSGQVLSTQELTITQYFPIEYTTPTDDPEIVEFIQSVFNKQSVTLWIDRVDREAMPWGFDGEVLDHNSNDGFHNAYHLIDPNPDSHPGRNHRTAAEKYLPWGKMNGGSAMVYSMSFWNLPTDIPNQNQNIVDMIEHPSFPDYTHQPEWTDKYWTLPSIVGWQIIEKASIAGKLDPNHPIVSYLPYWTSNASTLEGGFDDGATNAYTYQFGRKLHTLKKEDSYPIDLVRPRTDKFRFRLISVKP